MIKLVLNSAPRVSSLESIGTLDELALLGLIAVQCGMGTLLELGSGLLLWGCWIGPADGVPTWCFELLPF
jgi:hypothetical protein